ncbi:MAG: hypothetical protein AAFQ87_14445, partial [Bacteroidota bacterium]
MQYLPILLLFLLNASLLSAQLTYQWGHRIGDGLREELIEICPLSNQDFYICGGFIDSVALPGASQHLRGGGWKDIL